MTDKPRVAVDDFVAIRKWVEELKNETTTARAAVSWDDAAIFCNADFSGISDIVLSNGDMISFTVKWQSDPS